MPKKIKVELTENQVNDLITCVDYVLNKEMDVTYSGIGYGHIAGSELALARETRKRMLAKFVNIIGKENASTRTIIDKYLK